MKHSFISHLECSGCGQTYSHAQLQTICPACSSTLLARYDLVEVQRQVDPSTIARRPRGMWRWHELLPVSQAEGQITLGEGDTPLLAVPRLGARLGLPRLFVKDESANPTLSFKARGLAAAVSKAAELGVRKLIIPTAGNAGGALAAYAARAGMRAHIIMPTDTPPANIEESRVAGAEVVLIDGLISDAGRMANEKARLEDWFDLSTFKEPYRLEGKKIMGYELAQAFGWELPDVIIYPTGGGTGLVGMCKAFDELEALGWLKNTQRPRMVAVQADGCAPVVKAFEAGALTCEFWPDAHTIASGLRVPKSFADRLILRDVRTCNGTAVSVSDAALLQAQRELATCEGIFAAPEGAATLAGLRRLLDSGWIESDARVVLFNTGSGLKYLTPPA
jgi:threonine synthase